MLKSNLMLYFTTQEGAGLCKTSEGTPEAEGYFQGYMQDKQICL